MLKNHLSQDLYMSISDGHCDRSEPGLLQDVGLSRGIAKCTNSRLTVRAQADQPLEVSTFGSEFAEVEDGIW
jgi:hypothetical protein